MKSEGMETTGANCFKGEIGALIKEEVHEYVVDDSFEVLDFITPIRDIPEVILADMNEDQKYLYRIVRMIRAGNIDYNALKQVIGPLSHSRWLTAASRICRVWVSKHGLRKNGASYKSLKTIVSFIVSTYAPIWFDVKCQPNIVN